MAPFSKCLEAALGQFRSMCSSVWISPQGHRRASLGILLHLPVSIFSLCEDSRSLVKAFLLYSGTSRSYTSCCPMVGFRFSLHRWPVGCYVHRYWLLTHTYFRLYWVPLYLIQTVMVFSHQSKTTTRQRQDKCWTCAFLWSLSHQVCRTWCERLHRNAQVQHLSCHCLALVWKHH